ncbi:unnamed protein product [Prunus armeniaca]
MTSLGGLVITVSSFLCLLLVLVLIKILHKLWWAPARLQKLMASQGIKGPPYRLIHGNTKDISNMIKEAMSKPKSLSSSHDVLSVVQPHVHSWTKIYGKSECGEPNGDSHIISFFKLFKTGDEIESEKLEKDVRASILEIVRKREEKVMTGGEESFGSDFLGLLVKAHHDANDSQRISVDDLIDDCKTFYVAGQETTNSLLAWTVLLLAHHTDWQEEARKEVIQMFGKQTPNPDGIAKLKTMSMVINECLRLYSPVGAVLRKAEREVKLGKLIVPANVELIMSCLSLHHDPLIWGQDAQLFKPERFAEGVAKASNNNAGAFLPFGVGPRTCVGLNFATIEAKIALSMILQRYSFTLSPGYVHLPFQLLTNCPLRGVQVMLHSL